MPAARLAALSSPHARRWRCSAGGPRSAAAGSRPPPAAAPRSPRSACTCRRAAGAPGAIRYGGAGRNACQYCALTVTENLKRNSKLAQDCARAGRPSPCTLNSAGTAQRAPSKALAQQSDWTERPRSPSRPRQPFTAALAKARRQHSQSYPRRWANSQASDRGAGPPARHGGQGDSCRQTCGAVRVLVHRRLTWQ